MMFLNANQDLDFFAEAEKALSRPSINLFKIKNEIEKNKNEIMESTKSPTIIASRSSDFIGHWREKAGSARAPTGYKFLADGSYLRTYWLLDMSAEGVRFDHEENEGKWKMNEDGTVKVGTHTFKIVRAGGETLLHQTFLYNGKEVLHIYRKIQ